MIPDYYATYNSSIKNIKEVTGALREEILNSNVHTIDDMRVWLRPFGLPNAFIKGRHGLRRFESARHLIKIVHPCSKLEQ